MKFFSARQGGATQRSAGKPLVIFLASALMVSTIFYGCKRKRADNFFHLKQSELLQACSKIAKSRLGVEVKPATLRDAIEIEKDRNAMWAIEYISTDGKKKCMIFAVKQDDGTFSVVPKELERHVVPNYLPSK